MAAMDLLINDYLGWDVCIYIYTGYVDACNIECVSYTYIYIYVYIIYIYIYTHIITSDYMHIHQFQMVHSRDPSHVATQQ